MIRRMRVRPGGRLLWGPADVAGQDVDFRAEQEKREDLSSRRLLPWNGNTQKRMRFFYRKCALDYATKERKGKENFFDCESNTTDN